MKLDNVDIKQSLAYGALMACKMLHYRHSPRVLTVWCVCLFGFPRLVNGDNGESVKPEAETLTFLFQLGTERLELHNTKTRENATTPITHRYQNC